MGDHIRGKTPLAGAVRPAHSSPTQTSDLLLSDDDGSTATTAAGLAVIARAGKRMHVRASI